MAPQRSSTRQQSEDNIIIITVGVTARFLLFSRLHVPLTRGLASVRAMERPQKRQRPPDLTGEEMKRYEVESCDVRADMSRPCVVRLDGHWCVHAPARRALRTHTTALKRRGSHPPNDRSFHTYTKGFRRPFDTRINAAMVSTATDLLERFGAVTAYTESDEISLIWPPAADQGVQQLPFNGRVQKVVSVLAGFASARFNKHMLAQSFDAQSEAALISRVEASDAHFDARVFALPSADKVHEYMRWRALQDCRRNSVSMLAQAHFPHQRLQNKDARTMLRMLQEEKQVDWGAQPAFFRFGSYVKKEEYTKPAVNPITQQQVFARRTRSVERAFELPNDAQACSFLLSRFWEPGHPGAATDSAAGAAGS